MFFGWRIVGALFICLMFSSGIGFYNHSILIQALVRDSGFSIEAASGAVSVFFVVSGFTGLLIARLIESLAVKWIVIAGALAASIALIWIGHVKSVPELYVAYAVFGAGFAASGLIPATTLVARWFQKRRARALSVASTGLSVGGILVTPLCAALMSSVSLSEAVLYLALAYALGVMPVAMVLKSFPADVGQQPDGEPAPALEMKIDGMVFVEAVKHPFFWTLSVAYVLLMTAQVGGIAHQYGLISERLTLEKTAFALTLLPLFSIIGRLAGGVILDVIDTRKFTVVMIVVQGVSILSLGLLEHELAFYVGLSVFGITVGNLLMLQPLIIAEVYGLRNYARLYSWSNLITQIGVSGGPAVMGLLYGLSHGYQLPFVVAGLAGVLASIVFMSAKPPRLS